MPTYKHKDESYTEYRDRVVDAISPSFCGAKWYNATVWLGSGTTTSCHHPPAHKIPVEELKKSYKALHNTEYKKLVRKQMLDGERPTECEYCWKIEDLGKDKVSDRVYKSVIYSDDALKEAKTKYDWTKDVDLKTLEIAFDANCNYACSYCNASFSTTWMNDIRKNGAYQNLVSDGARAFQQDGKWAQPYGVKNKGNPYTEAFWEWWTKELQYSLEELRVTGGEATMSQDFWKLMDWWQDNPECEVRLAVNSNLGPKPELMQRLCDATHSFKYFDLYTSNEATGLQAEYIRDGLVWDTWISNCRKMMNEGNLREFHMMLTINALCLFSLPEFLDEMLQLKTEKDNKHFPTMSFNILRFPSFQSALVLPQEIRQERADALQQWIDTNGDNKYIHEMEIDGIKRLISYLEEVEEGHKYTSSIESRHRDFKSFYMQYDLRRNKSFEKAFGNHPKLIDWYNSLPVTNIEPIAGLYDGDSTKGWKHKQELEERAKQEGWVLDPQGANPGSQEYVVKDG